MKRLSVPVLALSGYARSGKDTAAEALVTRLGFVRVGFADALKAAAREIYGFSDAQLFGDEKELVDPRWGKSPRQILQEMGMKHREMDPETWIKAAYVRAEAGIAKGATGIAVSDCRFKNELDAVRAWGGEAWRISRPGVAAINTHVSETALDSATFDLHLANDTTIETFANAVVAHALAVGMPSTVLTLMLPGED